MNLDRTALCLISLMASSLACTQQNGAASDDTETQTPSSVESRECYEACIGKGEDEELCQKVCDELVMNADGAAKDPTVKPSNESVLIDPKLPTNEGDAASQKEPMRPPPPSMDNDGDFDERSMDGHKGPGEAFREEQIAAKSCVRCIEESGEAGQCTDQLNACEASLACSQLQWCPVLCDEKDCVSQCNEIIPSGVPLLRDLIQCAACGDGPCTSMCETSIYASYCALD